MNKDVRNEGVMGVITMNSSLFGTRPEREARRLVRLLEMGSESVNDYCGKDRGMDLLEECISHLRRHCDSSSEDTSEEPAWAKSSLSTLLRMLVYVHAEVRDTLHDLPCADLLKKCIEHIVQTHLLFDSNLAPWIESAIDGRMHHLKSV